MNSRTLVKITATEHCLSFRTVSRDRKSPHSFLILRRALDDLYDLPQMEITVNDIRSFAELHRNPLEGTVRIRFSWLGGDGFRLTGWEETVVLPFRELMEFSKSADGSRWDTLSLTERPIPRLVFHSQETLHKALGNKLVRRRLVRFLRDNFKWRTAEEIAFYDDFVPYSFFFREIRNGQPGSCGGLILHGQEKMETAWYSIHT